MSDTRTWNTIVQDLLQFRENRNWAQFHTLKDLAEAISIEAAEMLEIFLWEPARHTESLSKEEQVRIEQEAADILIFLIYLSVEARFDLFEAVQKKMAINEKKYPVEKAKGRSNKYSEL